MSRSLDSYAAEATELREVLDDVGQVLNEIWRYAYLTEEAEAEAERALNRYREAIDYEWK